MTCGGQSEVAMIRFGRELPLIVSSSAFPAIPHAPIIRPKHDYHPAASLLLPQPRTKSDSDIQRTGLLLRTLWAIRKPWKRTLPKLRLGLLEFLQRNGPRPGFHETNKDERWLYLACFTSEQPQQLALASASAKALYGVGFFDRSSPPRSSGRSFDRTWLAPSNYIAPLPPYPLTFRLRTLICWLCSFEVLTPPAEPCPVQATASSCGPYLTGDTLRGNAPHSRTHKEAEVDTEKAQVEDHQRHIGAELR
ncbi:uncharacterized protein BDZ83DRAFT_729314 [Colletotrichum acutatum]|uniref:Uncharacterized protein n=1 Tax=Glomerella acutata TaxID=27357 RepID=A0AAD8XJK9_GLOAC|nr:uncharacterized protein BDZ83DRAFT_729314 [Colletotrichum acutatum]KAK1726825.1 hypothetical protein BDZ83DRAFT_729314 [Colletotrichum acutatum]